MCCNLACLAGQLACCCAAKAPSLCNAKSSVMVRAFYSAQFVVGTVLAWALLHYGAKMPRTTTELCDAECWQYLAACRVSFAIVMYHSLLSLLTFGVKNSQWTMARVQNGFWAVKVLLWLALIISVFYIRDEFYYTYYIAALVFASLFILLQSFILVDFAWSWAQSWIEKWDETGEEWYKQMLIGLCVAFYLFTFVVTSLLYWFYAPLNKSAECGLNAYFISMNLVLVGLHSITAVLPQIQESTPKSGLFQSALLGAYTTYLTASALISQPNTHEMQCNPLLHEDGYQSGEQTPLANFMGYIGVFITFLALGYQAFSGGSTTIFEYQSLEDGPAAADGDTDNDDESDRTAYHYSFFHVTFVLAAFYMCMLLTNWSVVQNDATSPNGVRIAQGTSAVWVKVVTSWVCVVVYMWTLVAPLIFPERDFS